MDLRRRIRHREHHAVLAHRADELERQGVRPGHPDEDVGTREGLGLAAAHVPGVGLLGDAATDRVHALAPRLEDAVDVHTDDVADPGGLEQPDDGDAGGPHALHDDPQRGEVATQELGRVQQRGEHHDRGPVLVVVEHRDVDTLAQLALDLEAARRGDVLEVDPGEALRDPGDGVDERVGVLVVDQDRIGVHAPERLQEHALALHHGQ